MAIASRLNVTPRPTLDHVAHGRLANAVLVCKLLLGYAASGISSPNVVHRRFGQLSTTVFLAGVFSAPPSLGSHVAHVGGVVTSKQVFGVDAQRVVAPVQNPDAVGNRAVRLSVGPSVGVYQTATVSKYAVTCWRMGSGPKPTTGRFGDLFPEPNFCGLPNLNPCMVLKDEPQGLALDPPLARVISGREWGHTTATALTKSIRHDRNIA